MLVIKWNACFDILWCMYKQPVTSDDGLKKRNVYRDGRYHWWFSGNKGMAKATAHLCHLTRHQEPNTTQTSKQTHKATCLRLIQPSGMNAHAEKICLLMYQYMICGKNPSQLYASCFIVEEELWASHPPFWTKCLRRSMSVTLLRL